MAAWYDDEINKELIARIAAEEGVSVDQVVEIIAGAYDMADGVMRNNYDHINLIRFGRFSKHGVPMRMVKKKD